MSKIFRDVAWKLINLRQEKGLTQDQLGEKIGLSKYQISRIERGQGDTTMTNLELVAKFHEIQLSALFEETKKVDVDIELRKEYLEKSEREHFDRSYSKVFDQSAKVRSVKIPAQTFRRIKIEDKSLYDFYVINGNVTVYTKENMESLKSRNILTVKGHGTLKFTNTSLQNAEVLMFNY